MLIYITGGKTLGHITPLINIYTYFKNEHEFVYFGLENSLEEEICKQNNIKFIKLKLKGLNRKNIFKNFDMLKLIKYSNNIVKEELKNKPDLIIASSGFVCFSLLYKSKNISIFLLEQNTTLGLINKLFYHKSNKLFLSLPIEKEKSKSILSGNFILNNTNNYDNINFYTKKPKILLFFGSMGSSKLYDYFLKNDNLFKEYSTFIIVPEKFYDNYVFKNYIKLRPISNLNSLFNRFDILITRAGATTIAEILKSDVKALLIPSPNVVNNHQEKNAILMKKNNLIDYILEKDINNIEQKITDLKTNNNIEKRKLYYAKDSFSILKEEIQKLK